MKKLIITFDDFSPRKEYDCMDSIDYLIKNFPNIKIGMFTIPCLGRKPIYLYNDWCNKVIKLIDKGNLEIYVHGYTHNKNEFNNISKDVAISYLKNSENLFNRANIPFKKIFAAPNSNISSEACNALEYMGYKAIFTNQKKKNDYVNFKFNTILPTWDLKNKYINNNNDTVITCGHTHNVCGNYILDALPKIIHFIETNIVKFKFLSEELL